ncbi:hypothetical protein QZH41_002975 [Actinostola sp. cb2023]|nr:hypothetical protein QZH41_002975 [Actinostola sp. cb2023]
MDDSWTIGNCAIVDRSHTTLLCDVCQGCKVNCRRKDFEGHKNECNFRPQECGQCWKLVPLLKLPIHQKEECIKRQVVCPYYQATSDTHSIKMCDALMHFSECKERVTQCDIIGCEFFGTKQDLKMHDSRELLRHNSLLKQAQRKLVTMAMTKNLISRRSQDSTTTTLYNKGSRADVWHQVRQHCARVHSR